MLTRPVPADLFVPFLLLRRKNVIAKYIRHNSYETHAVGQVKRG